VDQDCDGEIDEAGAEGERPWYADEDGDGYGDPGVSMIACAAPAGYVADDTDCDDTDAAIHPEAEETWYDGVDQDCDGNDDDKDGDGYAVDADCDDADPAIHEGCEDIELPKEDTGTGKSGGCACAATSPTRGETLGAFAALMAMALLSARRRRRVVRVASRATEAGTERCSC
jgi:MYXO-CTERM domain-containing protein